MSTKKPQTSKAETPHAEHAAEPAQVPADQKPFLSEYTLLRRLMERLDPDEHAFLREFLEDGNEKFTTLQELALANACHHFGVDIAPEDLYEQGKGGEYAKMLSSVMFIRLQHGWLHRSLAWIANRVMAREEITPEDLIEYVAERANEIDQQVAEVRAILKDSPQLVADEIRKAATKLEVPRG